MLTTLRKIVTAMRRDLNKLMLRPPPSVNEDPDYLLTKKLPDRVFFRGYPLAEPVENLIGDDAPPASEQRAAASLSALLDG